MFVFCTTRSVYAAAYSMLVHMLSHKYRFHGHGSLRYLFRNGAVVRSRYMSMRFVTNKQRVHSRVTIIVSKKTFKSAVKRNRSRRRIYELVRNSWDQFPTSCDIAITVNSPEVIALPSSVLMADYVSLLQKTHLNPQD
jgi:ribonuclease P protein component